MPVCKGCGSSYDDTYKFCPYCGQSKPEPETIRLQVEVSERDSWETCEIHRHRYHYEQKKDRGWRLIDAEGYLWAKAIGPKGVYTAGNSPIYSVNTKEKSIVQPPRIGKEQKFSGIEAASTFLVNQLIRDGWEATGRRGAAWWQDQFRRRLSGEYPFPWTTWEVEFRPDGLTRGVFYIQRAPVRAEESPVRGPESERFKLKALRPIQYRKDELLPPLNRFLDRLEADGFERVPASADERGMRCRKRRYHSYDFRENRDKLWYYRALLKRSQ